MSSLWLIQVVVLCETVTSFFYIRVVLHTKVLCLHENLGMQGWHGPQDHLFPASIPWQSLLYLNQDYQGLSLQL